MRALVAFLAGILACVVLPFAIAATWTDAVVNDTDRYVDTVGPLAADERVQEAVADRLTDIATGSLSLSLTREVVHQAALEVVASDEFARVWRAANRAMHPQLLRLLRHGGGGEVRLDLSGLVDAMATELGAGQLSSLPGASTTDISFTVARSENLREARAVYRVVDPAGFWLPVVWAGLVALTLLAAARRRRALSRLGLGSALALGLAWLALGIAGAVFADNLPGADADLADAVFDVVTGSLETALVTGLVVGVVVAVALGVTAGVPRRRTLRAESPAK